MAAKFGGAATYKVKVHCPDAKDRKALLKEVVKMGHQKHRVVKYVTKRPVLQVSELRALGCGLQRQAA